MANLRLFWALEIGAAARARAAGIADALRESCGRDVRWVREESLHVTLRFLGSVDSARIEDLEREVGRATRGIASFAVAFAGVEVFPARRPRVIALGLEPREALAALAAGVERGAVAAGFAPEPRPFRAHLTLGRVRDGRRFRPAADVTASVTARGDAWDVVEIVLFRSDLAPSGSRYTPLVRVPLHP